MTVNGKTLLTNNRRVEEKTKPLLMTIQRHHEEITFDIMRMATHDIVLGIPWLIKHNLKVDWESRRLTFERCNTVDWAGLMSRPRRWDIAGNDPHLKRSEWYTDLLQVAICQQDGANLDMEQCLLANLAMLVMGVVVVKWCCPLNLPYQQFRNSLPSLLKLPRTHVEDLFNLQPTRFRSTS